LLGAGAVESRGHLVFTAGLEYVSHGPAGLFAAGRPAFLIAHTGSEVIGTDEDRIDPGHGKDGIGVFHRPDVFALQDHEDLVVGAGVVFIGAGGKVKRVDAAADAAIAHGRVLRRRDGRQGLL